MISIPIISEFNGTGISNAIQQFKQLEGAGAKAQFALKKAAVPATAALGALAIASKLAITAASDMVEAQSKVNVLFGDGATDIEKYAKTASAKIGQSKKSVMDAAGTFGTFGKAAGLNGKDLAKFATGFTGLASDLASFNNTTPEEAIQAIGAALRGESEPMRQFGVLLNDASLKAEAMKLGIYDGTGALTAQEKILAAQAAIYEQTTAAQGDFARTSDGLANSQRTLKAQFDDVQVSLGQALLPVVDALLPKVKAFADWAAENPGTFKLIAATIGAVALAVIAVNAAMALNPFSLIAAGVALLVVGLAVAYKKFDGFREVVNGIVNFVSDAFETMGNAIIMVLNAVIRAFNLLPGKDIPTIPHLSLGKIGGGGGGGGGGASIPKMADGGIVTSPTLALIGEAGPEAVVPLSKMGGMGGVTINVNGGDPQAVVNALRSYMFQNGSVPIRVSG